MSEQQDSADLDAAAERVIDFMNKLCPKNATPQDLKNIIAAHVDAALSNMVNVLDGEFDKDQITKVKTNLKKSFDNLEKHAKMENNDLKVYYSRILKSQLLFFCYNGSFLSAETDLFPFINSIKLDSSSIVKDSLKEVYLCALSYFVNSIGSELFVACDSNKKSVEKTLNTLKLEPKNDEVNKSFQRTLTRNGFIRTFGFNDATKDIIKLFKITPRFKFEDFTKIFSIRTDGKGKSDFESSIKKLLESTVGTPLLFLDRFSKGIPIKLLKEIGPSFISSPPHAYENLIIDKLAFCYAIPSKEQKENDEEEDEEEEEEESVESSSYIQLLAANLRLKQPPVQYPELKIFKILKIKPTEEAIPTDIEIRGTCTNPFYYRINDEDGEEDTDDKIKNELVSKDCQKKLRNSFYTGIQDGLQPIEAQLARILEFSALKMFSNVNGYKTIFDNLFSEVDNKEHQRQIDISRSLISLLLYPETRIGLVQDSTDLFILSAFSELWKLLQASKVTDSTSNAQEYLIPGKVRRVFQLAMDGIIPAVHQNIVKLADWTQGKSTSKDYDEPDSDKYHSIYPFSSYIFLKQFIVDPGLRRKCPVIYAYLRLQSRFCLTSRIYTIADMLHRVWDKYQQLVADVEPPEDDQGHEEDENEEGDGKTFAELEIDDDQLRAFLDCWRGAVQFIDCGPMTSKARARLEKTVELADLVDSELEEGESLGSKVFIRPFLPYEPTSWPGLIVLESLSKAHNEFISILQQHAKIHSFDINDKDFNKSKVMETTIFGQFLVRAVRGHLGPDCLPIFDEECERYFVQQASLLPYYYIIHPGINYSLSEDISMSSKGLVTLYEERFDTIDLSEEQKKMLHKYIKEDDKTAGALLLLTKFMFTALDDRNSNAGNFQSTTYLSTFIEKANNITKTPIEEESYSALLVAKGKLREDFKVGQFSKIYTFLSDPIDQCRKAFSLQEAVIKNVITACEIKDAEIDNIGLPNVTDYRPYFTVIPKVFADLLNQNECNSSKEFTSLTPTKLIEKWRKIDEKKRMLIDKDEENALKAIAKLDEGKNNNKLVTLIAYFNDAMVNYKW